MSIFGKKPKNAEDIIALLSNLDADELEKVNAELEKVKAALVEKDESEDVGEEVEKAEENIAEKGEDSQSEADRVDESVGEQEDHHEEDAEADEKEAEADAGDIAEAVEMADVKETADENAEDVAEHKAEDEDKWELVFKKLTEFDARFGKIEKALEIVGEEEIGADADLVDDINDNAMPASYLEKAKNMRI
ncbi:MAG: hypothetical protein IJ999_01005 [Clostridia bacterium]|nr:hypothetical protein [Clostridia bacterium]